jgi:hypothetical protein
MVVEQCRRLTGARRRQSSQAYMSATAPALAAALGVFFASKLPVASDHAWTASDQPAEAGMDGLV